MQIAQVAELAHQVAQGGIDGLDMEFQVDLGVVVGMSLDRDEAKRRLADKDALKESLVENLCAYLAELNDDDVGSLITGYRLTRASEGAGGEEIRLTALNNMETLADSEFENYDFGDGVQISDHGRWDKTDPKDWIKKAYAVFEGDAAEDGSHSLSFHVRFADDGGVSEAYTLECEKGLEIGRRVLPCVRVEYHPAFWGGDFDGVGQFVLIPLRDVAAFAMGSSRNDAVEMAFRKQTNQDSVHIIHYSLDELYDQHGKPILRGKSGQR